MLLLLILVLSDFSNLLRGAEQTAGGVDVLAAAGTDGGEIRQRSEEHTSELQSLS